MVLVHRLTWINTNGPIPKGMCVLHTCDNPPCVNLDHLFLGTQADNIADMVAKGRQRGAPGSSNGFAKLTEGQVVAIKERLAQGESGRNIANDYPVQETTISHIKTGRMWSQVGA